MSYAMLTEQFIADSRLSLNDFRVFSALLSFRNAKTGKCCPSREAIAERCALPVAKVSTATSRLQVFGWLKKITGKGRGRRVWQYDVIAPDLATGECEKVPEKPPRKPRGKTAQNESNVTVSVTSPPPEKTAQNESDVPVSVKSEVPETVTSFKRHRTDHFEQTIKQTPQSKAKAEEPALACGEGGFFEPFDEKPDTTERSFERFWSAYPRKADYLSARQAWKKLAPNAWLADEIIHHVSARSTADPHWVRDNGRAIPYPANFLKNERWRDVYLIRKRWFWEEERIDDPNDPIPF